MKVAFLDRDGVINREVNYLYKINDFIYTDNCISGLKTLRALGFELIIITNQAGIAKGIYSEKEFHNLSEWLHKDLSKNGVELLDSYYCPHHPNGIIKKFSKECECRKPKPGMLNLAKEKYGISMKNSILIGDKPSDIYAGNNAGIGSSYLVESGHKLKKIDRLIAPTYKNLYEVARFLSNTH